MITREEALERALDYLGRRYSGRLEAFEGWPGEAQREEAGAPDDEPSPTIAGFPRRVWSVRLPGDGMHVGSSEYVIVDADTGRVFTEMHWGE